MKSKSRSSRFQDAMDKVSTAKCDIEELRDEVQNWYDNLPENLQNGMKADALQSCIDELESVIGSLEDAEGYCPEFPGMYS